MPGLNDMNPNLPFFALTEYGSQVITTQDPVPHDPDQYFEHLRQVAPRLDPVATIYVAEGLECFQRGTYTASVIMLGVASEKMTLDLANTVQRALNGTETNKLLRVIQTSGIARIYE